MRIRFALLATIVAATFAVAAPANAACESTVGAGDLHVDRLADSELGLAPDIDTVRVSIGGQCDVVLSTGVVRPLGDSDAAFVFIDADGNPATGDPVFAGADVAIGTIGSDAGQLPPLRGTWDGEGFAFIDPTPVGPALGHGGFEGKADAIGLVSGVTARLTVMTITMAGDDTDVDIAPDPGRNGIFVPVGYRITAPPVLAPTPRSPVRAPVRTPRPATTAPARVPTAPARTACVMPRTKGLTVGRARSRLIAAGCAVAAAPRRAYSASVRRGRVVRTSTSGGRVTLIVSKGRRPRRARSAAATTVLDRLTALAIAARERPGR